MQIPLDEFYRTDPKENAFFNWAMIPIHPYATAFFEKVAHELGALSLNGNGTQA